MSDADVVDVKRMKNARSTMRNESEKIRKVHRYYGHRNEMRDSQESAQKNTQESAKNAQNAQNTQKTQMPRGTPVVEVRNVSKRYGLFFALKSVSLSVKAGESVALLGPNGAGKTTLLKIIATLIKPTEGVVRLFGEDASSNAIKQRIGVVMHESFLYDELTVLENLNFYAKLFQINATRPPAHSLTSELTPESAPTSQSPTASSVFSESSEFTASTASTVSAEDEIEALIDFFGMRRWLNVKAKHLSYGLRKRADIVRALVHRPDLVILDEPFGGLDESSREILVEYFSECDKTVVLSSHSVDWARKVCERAVLLERGAVKREIRF